MKNTRAASEQELSKTREFCNKWENGAGKSVIFTEISVRFIYLRSFSQFSFITAFLVLP